MLEAGDEIQGAILVYILAGVPCQCIGLGVMFMLEYLGWEQLRLLAAGLSAYGFFFSGIQALRAPWGGGVLHAGIGEEQLKHQRLVPSLAPIILLTSCNTERAATSL